MNVNLSLYWTTSSIILPVIRGNIGWVNVFLSISMSITPVFNGRDVLVATSSAHDILRVFKRRRGTGEECDGCNEHLGCLHHYESKDVFKKTFSGFWNGKNVKKHRTIDLKFCSVPGVVILYVRFFCRVNVYTSAYLVILLAKTIGLDKRGYICLLFSAGLIFNKVATLLLLYQVPVIRGEI